jgi:hypothetical protein
MAPEQNPSLPEAHSTSPQTKDAVELLRANSFWKAKSLFLYSFRLGVSFITDRVICEEIFYSKVYPEFL